MRSTTARAVMAMAAACAAIPALAQQATPTPSPTPTRAPAIITLPGAERFSLQPSGPQTSRPTPTPLPTRAAPTPSPSATLAPTPRPTPAAASTPAPRAAPRTAEATPTPVATPSAAPVPIETQPVQPAPAFETPAPAVAETPVPAEPEAAPGSLPWSWIAAAVVAALALLAFFVMRRRRKVEDAQESAYVPPAPPPVPAAPRPAASPQPPRPPAPRPAPVAPPPPDPMLIEVHPVQLMLGERDLAIDLEIVVANATGAPADGIRLSIALATASPQQDMLIRGFLGAPAGGEDTATPFDLAPGRGGKLPVRVSLPRKDIHRVDVGGRAMFVPLVLVSLRWRGGLSVKRHGGAFMIGTAPPQGSGKLGPIWLDRNRQSGLAASRYYPRPIADDRRSA